MLDFIQNFSIVGLWIASATFRAFVVTVLWGLATKYIWLPIYQTVLPRLDDRWIWFGKDSDLIDKPWFFISSVISGFLGLWTIKLLFIAIFLT